MDQEVHCLARCFLRTKHAQEQFRGVMRGRHLLLFLWEELYSTYLLFLATSV